MPAHSKGRGPHCLKRQRTRLIAARAPSDQGSISAPVEVALSPSCACRYNTASRLAPMNTPGTHRYTSIAVRNSGWRSSARSSKGPGPGRGTRVGNQARVNRPVSKVSGNRAKKIQRQLA
ncbi:hypothetical protein D3C80_1777500 [compost metagenome]